MSQELQEEPRGVEDTTLHPHCPQILHVLLSHSQSSRSKRKPVNTWQGPHSLSEEGTQDGGRAHRAQSPCSVGFGSLGATLVGCPVPTEACPFLLRRPCPPETPLQVLASKYCSCGWEARAAPRDQQDLAGPLGWSAGRFCGFFPKSLQQQGRSEKPLWGQGWGNP